jgi:hypothetical protein
VGSRRVGEEGGVMAVAANGVENRQPRFVPRVKAARSDSRQLAVFRQATVFVVHLQQLRDRRLRLIHCGGSRISPHRLTAACEASRQRLADGADSLAPHSPHLGQSPVVRCSLQLGERLDSELLVDTPRQFRPDIGHGGEGSFRDVFASQTLQQRKAAGANEVIQDMRQRAADARQLHQPQNPFGPHDIVGFPFQPANRLGGVTIGAYAKGIGRLQFEQVRDFLERRGELVILEHRAFALGANHRGSSAFWQPAHYLNSPELCRPAGTALQWRIPCRSLHFA